MGDKLEDDKEDAEELKIQQMTEPEQKGYKDWLAAAAQVIFASHWSILNYNWLCPSVCVSVCHVIILVGCFTF